MKHNLLKSVILSVILFMGVNNAWAGTKVVSSPKIYYDNTPTSYTNVAFMVGHESYSRAYKLTKINNTNLWYRFLKNTGNDHWNDAKEIAIFGVDWDTAEGNPIESRASHTSDNYTLLRTLEQASGSCNSLDLEQSFLITSDGNKKTTYIYHKPNGYSDLNYTQTIKQEVSLDNGVTYSESNLNLATVKINTYQLNGEASTTQSTCTITSGSSSANCLAAHSAIVTYNRSGVNKDYEFVGWFDGNTQLSTAGTYTPRATGPKTITARFKKKHNFIVRGGAQFGNTWASNVNIMAKQSESEQIVYFTVSITGRNITDNTSNPTYQFKIYDEFTGKWYGLTADDSHFWYKRDMGEQNLVSGDNGKNIELRADVPGEYVIKVDYSDENQPKITITYPEKHTVTLHPVADEYGNKGYGHFTVENSGTRYTSSPSKTIRFDVASGSTITIVESQHNYPEIFNGDLAWKKSGDEWTDDNYLSDPKNYQLTVISDIEIAENFCVRDKTVKDKNLHLFLKIPKSLDKKIDGTEVGWRDNDSNDGDAAAGYSEKAEDCANFVWLGIAFFDERIKGSTLEERGCIGTEQPEGSYLMKPLLIEDNYYNYYYCTITDSCWFNVKFERKHADSDAGLPQLMAAEVQRFPGDGKVCFTITGYDNERGFVGDWEEAPKCKVTLGYTDIGRFGVEYNGEVIYEDKAKQEDGERDPAVIEVPFDAEIKVLAGEPGNDAFVNSMVYIDETGKKTKLDFTEQITSHTFKVRGDVKVDDLFGTKQKNTIYMGIPKNQDGFEDWDLACTNPNHNGDEMYIWCHWPYGGFGGYENYGNNELIKRNGIIINTEDMIYYQFDLPQGVYAFAFQCKENKDIDNSSTEHATSVYQYNPPLTTADCFVLDGGKSGDGGKQYSGYWTSMPSDGDFRLLYVEQEVIKAEDTDGDKWITEVKRTYQHPSDIVKPQELEEGDKIVSLHIYTRGKNPEIILQKYSDTQNKWIDIEAHMVNGPLEATPGMGMLPGRKNAGPGSEVDDFVYDDGIEKIKNDDEDDGCGVWDFTIKKIGDNVQLDLVNGLKRYTGKYYIRTTNAEGEWMNYTLPSNYMTYSAYAKKNSGFSHYFCKWVDINKHYRDVSFIIANDHAQNLTDPSSRFVDNYVVNQWLPENANVRWGWDIVTNKVSRAYIQGTWTTAEPPARLDNIVLNYKQSDKSNAKNIRLHDSGDWIYAVNLDKMQVGAYLNSLTAQYPKTGNTQYFAKDIEMLTGESSNTNNYVVRVQYDFKIDHTLIALLPNDKEANIGIDVVIERVDQKDATQVQASVTSKKVTQEDGSTREGSTVYGVFTFTKTFLTDNTLENQERFTHWFSFPFDVKLSDVFGFSPVGDYWMIRKYNGDKRAADGLNETNTFWEYELDPNATLEANKGYILVLSTNLKYKDRDIYINRDTLSLYFPATDLVTNINSEYLTTEVDVPSHKNQNTTLKDWNWNMIGMPSYANKQATITQDHLYYFYDYSHKTNSYEVVWTGEKAFKSTFAYMVQFAGTINWKEFNFKAQGLAPRERTDEEIQKHVLRLDLQRAGAREDKTYIQLIDENATTDFDMNLDLTKMLNSSKSNLYSLLNNHRLAANVLPIEETIIPLGVVSAAVGEYTFAMPNGTDGIVVELIDYETNTRTNMLLDEYTINLGKGTFENRFALHVKPNKTTTSIVDVNTNSNGVRKFIIDGTLYMQKDGVLYDAQGRCVQ